MLSPPLYLSSPLSFAQETHIKFISLCRATLTSQDGPTTLLLTDDSCSRSDIQIELDTHLDNDTFFFVLLKISSFSLLVNKNYVFLKSLFLLLCLLTFYLFFESVLCIRKDFKSRSRHTQCDKHHILLNDDVLQFPGTENHLHGHDIDTSFWHDRESKVERSNLQLHIDE